MRKDKNPALAEHFQRLKEILPEVYQPRSLFPENDPMNDRLVALLKQALIVIEAMYLQNQESFSTARVEAYVAIVSELNALGVKYSGHEGLMSKSTTSLARLPMERAGRRSVTPAEEKKAM